MTLIAVVLWVQLFIILILVKYPTMAYPLQCVLMGILFAVGLIPPAQGALADQKREQK